MFGCLHVPIFKNSCLSVDTKRKVYKAVVLPVLLYGAETWTMRAEDMRRVNNFHRKCMQSIVQPKKQHWQDMVVPMSAVEVKATIGIEEDMVHLLMSYRLRWLGHVARMGPERIPKQLLFGELVKTRPRHKPKKRWRDIVLADLKATDTEENWYEMAQDRKAWRSICGGGLSALVEQSEQHRLAPVVTAANKADRVYCYQCECGRSFWRTGDLKRHQRFCKVAQSSTDI